MYPKVSQEKSFQARILASNYTLAAWVNIPSFDFLNASDAAVISIFHSLGLSGGDFFNETSGVP